MIKNNFESDSECPECRGPVDPRATRCRHCRIEFSDSQRTEIRKSSKVAGQVTNAIILGIVVFFVFIGMLSNDKNGANSDTALQSLNDIGTDDAEPSAPKGWQYRTSTDEVRNGTVRRASIRSQNTQYLAPPYGEIGMDLIIRKNADGKLDVAFAADSGQILCRSYEHCKGMINFDGKPETFTGIGAGDGSSEYAFAVYPQAIERKIAKADKVIVELPFYDNGNRQFTFQTKGLKWPPPKEVATAG